MKEEIKIGKYKHYKGSICQVIGVARHSEDYNQKLVVYSHPNENGVEQLWVRPISMFLENVKTDKYNGPRFKYIQE